MRAKVGKQYRFGPEEGVEVDAVDEVGVSAIDAEEAHRSGFTSATELRDFLIKHSTTFTSKSTVFRVSFHYVNSSDEVPQADLSLAEIQRRLDYFEAVKKWQPEAGRIQINISFCVVPGYGQSVSLVRLLLIRLCHLENILTLIC